MSRKRYRLTPALMQQILSGIRAGGYPHVVAQAWGVPPAVFEGWLRKGDGPNGRKPYVAFAAEVRQAHAQARLRAENEVFSDKVQVWLEHGPGRERSGQPGWSAAVKGPSAGPVEEVNPWLSPDFLALIRGAISDLE